MSGLFPSGKSFLQSILDGDADGVDALEHLMQVDRGIKKRAHELVFKTIGSKTGSKGKSK